MEKLSQTNFISIPTFSIKGLKGGLNAFEKDRG